MTPELRAVLTAIVDGDGGGYKIVTIEYPCDTEGGLKTVTRQIESDVVDVDIYGPDGTTKETRWFVAPPVY